MSTKIQRLLPITILTLAILACNIGNTAPATRAASTEAPAIPETEAATVEASTTVPTSPSAGSCANIYMPVVLGAEWTYALTGPIPDTYIHSIVSVEETSFTEQDVFGTGVTRQGNWNCDNGNLVALNPAGDSSANISAEGVSVDFQTTELEGVTLPATINPGDTWSQSLTLEGTQTVNGLAFPARNEMSVNCTAIGIESVTVAAGTFEALRVDCAINMNISITIENNAIQSPLAFNSSTWYAPKVGMVKSISTGGGLDSTIELTSYAIP